MSGHIASCRWELTTPAECEYRATHHYCPHPEHECNCPAAAAPTPSTPETPTACICNHGESWHRYDCPLFNPADYGVKMRAILPALSYKREDYASVINALPEEEVNAINFAIGFLGAGSGETREERKKVQTVLHNLLTRNIITESPAAPAQAEQEEFEKLIDKLLCADCSEDANAAYDSILSLVRRLIEQRDEALVERDLARTASHNRMVLATQVVRELRSRVRELEADAKRLDWLEARETVIRTQATSHDSRVNIEWTPNGYAIEIKTADFLAHIPNCPPSLRIAIDRASTDREQGRKASRPDSDMNGNKSVVRANAEKDPTYRPYCMRCPGLVRMQIVEPMLWECCCGAVHDERVGEPEHITQGPALTEAGDGSTRIG